MKLSIVNYGSGVNVKIPEYAKREDGELLKAAQGVIESMNFGKGAVIVSEVLHTDLTNLNWRKYMVKGMAEAAKSFYDPHFTPFLMHHNDGGGSFLSDGDPNLISVGTNVVSRFFKRAVDTATGPATGYVKVATFIRADKKIGDMLAVDAIQSRQLLNLSIGAKISKDNYLCSICHNPRGSEDCNHMLGEEYDGTVCCAEVYNPFFREYSSLYNAADINALIRRMDVMEGHGDKHEEHIIDQMGGGWNVSLYEITGSKIHALGAPAEEEDEPKEGNATMSKPDQNTAADSKDQKTAPAPAGDAKDNQAAAPGANAQVAPTTPTNDSDSAVLIEGLQKELESKNRLVSSLTRTLRDAMQLIQDLTDEEIGDGEPQGAGTDAGTGSGEGAASSADSAATKTPPASQGTPAGTSEPNQKKEGEEETGGVDTGSGQKPDGAADSKKTEGAADQKQQTPAGDGASAQADSAAKDAATVKEGTEKDSKAAATKRSLAGGSLSLDVPKRNLPISYSSLSMRKR